MLFFQTEWQHNSNIYVVLLLQWFSALWFGKKKVPHFKPETFSMYFLDLLKTSYIHLVRCFNTSCLHIPVSPVLRRYRDMETRVSSFLAIISESIQHIQATGFKSVSRYLWMCWMLCEIIARKLETQKDLL